MDSYLLHRGLAGLKIETLRLREGQTLGHLDLVPHQTVTELDHA